MKCYQSYNTSPRKGAWLWSHNTFLIFTTYTYIRLTAFFLRQPG